MERMSDLFVVKLVCGSDVSETQSRFGPAELELDIPQTLSQLVRVITADNLLNRGKGSLNGLVEILIVVESTNSVEMVFG